MNHKQITGPAWPLQSIPLLQRDFTTYDSFYLANHHAELGYGVLGIRGDSEAVVLIDHKLMAGSRKRAIEA